jgi:oligopeptide transport system substrate-binding protein
VRLLVTLPLLLAVFTSCTARHSGNPNTLNTSSIAKFKGLDPALGEDIYQSGAEVLVYEAMLSYDPFKRPYTLVPLTAEAMPTVSKDGLTYTFKIRKGIVFHDDAAFPEGKGRELKAKDYEYSIKRLADPKIQSTGFWLFENHIVGLDEWKAKFAKDGAKADYDEAIPGLKVVDDYTLQITLKQPYPQLLNALAMSPAVAVAREVVEKYGQEFMNHAVGTGAFRITSFEAADHITFEKNAKYWGKFPEVAGNPDSGKQLPLVDGINLRVITETQPAWLHFMRGELDRYGIPKDNFSSAVKVLDPSKPSAVENLELLPELKAKGMEIYGGVSMDLTYDAFNNESTQIPQFKNKKIRQAISLALDYKEAISVLYNNAAVPAQTPIPPGMNGYDANYKSPYRTGDIEKAKKMLAEAGYPGGKGFPVIPFDSLADSTSRQFAEYVGNRLKLIGLTISVQSNTWPAMLKRIQNRDAQLWGLAWAGDYPDAENFLQLFYSKNAVAGGTNGSYYKNKDYDALLEKARILPDSPARSAMYSKLAQMIAEDCPVVLGVHRLSVGLRQGWIKNDAYDDNLAFPRSKFLRIDLEAKKKLLGE